jgi:glycosyltransferase involved in cell wall biosynthesis
MKSLILCCNYNEEKTGNLERCLKAFQENKLENTLIGIIDNNSKDKSVELINEYVKNKTIDGFISSSINLGKPKALNALFKYMMGAYKFYKNDICIHVDSDIKMYDNFIKTSEQVFQKFNDCYLFFSFGSSKLDEFEYDNGHYFKLNDLEKVDDNFGRIQRGPGIQGAIWSMPISSFMNVNLYRENNGKNGNSAIYGGDDGFLVYDLFNKNPNKFAYADLNLYHYHPPVLDLAYKEWKNEQNSYAGLITKTPEANEKLAIKGFYD